MKKRASDRQPWMSPEDYGRSIRPGIGFNLLVKDVARSVKFAEGVLGATATYADEDFAVLRLNGSEWMLHALPLQQLAASFLTCWMIPFASNDLFSTYREKCERPRIPLRRLIACLPSSSWDSGSLDRPSPTRTSRRVLSRFATTKAVEPWAPQMLVVRRQGHVGLSSSISCK